MKVVQFSNYGDPEVLEVAEAPMPQPGAGQIRLRVAAIGVNPADPKWRQGMFRSFAPVPLPHILGYDVAGTVDALGDGVSRVAVGDRVVTLLDAFLKGAYAEFVLISASDAVPIPDRLDFARAAALPTPGLTGLQMAEEHAKVSPGHVVLITGATGAVGRFALHAARRAGASVVAAVRPAHADLATQLGATDVIDLDDGAWRGGPFDHVLDTTGGTAVARLCRHLRPGGRIITVATTPINGDGLNATPEFVAIRKDCDRLRSLVDAVARGEVDLPVARRLPLSQARLAHELVERGGIGGKIVLEP